MKLVWFMMVLLSLSACYEDTDVVLHQPGIYKGKVDLHEQTATQRSALLKQRFNQVQTDR